MRHTSAIDYIRRIRSETRILITKRITVHRDATGGNTIYFKDIVDNNTVPFSFP